MRRKVCLSDEYIFNGAVNTQLILCRSEGDGKNDRRILATSAAIENVNSAASALSTSKRPYCNDYIERIIPFSVQSVITDMIKASIVAFLPVTVQYANYLDAKEIAETECLEFDDEFDVEKKMKENMPLFKDKFARFFCTTTIRNLMQAGAVNYFPLRLADRLTKDYHKSLARKRLRYTQLDAAGRIFKTAAFSHSVYMAAGLSTDLLFGVAAHLRNGKRIKPLRSLSWICKKIIFYSVSCAAHSGGYALGAAIAPGLLPSAIALWMEVFCGYLVQITLSIQD